MNFIKDNILLDVVAKDKEDLLALITDYADKQGVISDKKEVLKAFIEREAEFSTGLQEGFAIPHAKSEGVSTATVLYLRTKDVLEWETFDDGNVQHVFALLVPKAEEGQVHLEMISKLATALMDDDFKDKVKNSNERTELAKIIKDEMLGEKLL